MTEKFQNYQGFKEIQAMLQEDLIRLEDCCGELKLSETQNSIAKMREKVMKDNFNIAIVGEFKRGKSTLINGLLGEYILPADPLPCSATLNRVTYDVTPHASICFQDGTVQNISVEELENYVTKLTEESEAKAATIKESTVYYPLVYCKNNVDIIDTPGLNDDDNMTQVTLSVIPQADLSVFVIMALSPFSQYEKDFLENKLMTSDVGKIVFAVTKIDLVDESDRERVIEHIRREIKKHILVKAEKVYGKDSEEYKSYQMKLGNIKVIGISPKLALEGKKKFDEQMIKNSNYPEFEKELEHTILMDRGIIQLSAQTNKIISTSAEILKVISLYASSDNMSVEEFEKKYQATLKSFEQIRADRKKEEARISVGAGALLNDIRAMIDDYWIETENGVNEFIDQLIITDDDLKQENIDATKNQLSESIQEYLNNSQSVFNDKIQVRINEAVGRETERIGNFENNFLQSVDDVHMSFTGGDFNTTETVASTAGSVLTIALMSNPLGYAAGGIYSGYKQGGIKGAVVGGLTTFGTGFVVDMGITTLLTAAGVTITSAIAWPVIIGAGLVGTLVGKNVLKKVFGSDSKIDKFKTACKKAITDSLKEYKQNSVMDAEIEKQVKELFDKMQENLHNETEQILKNTETTLNELRQKKSDAQSLQKQEAERMAKIGECVNEIAARAIELNKQIEQSMGV